MGSSDQTSDRTHRAGIRNKIMTEMVKHPGVPIWLGQIQEVTGETDVRRVQGALAWLARDPSTGIRAHTRGQAWVYSPTAARGSAEASRELLEVIGQSKKDGSLVCEGEDGTLYRAVPIN